MLKPKYHLDPWDRPEEWEVYAIERPSGKPLFTRVKPEQVDRERLPSMEDEKALRAEKRRHRLQEIAKSFHEGTKRYKRLIDESNTP